MNDVPIYSIEIMQIAANMPDCNRLQKPDASVRKTAPICGSVIEVDIEVENGYISAFGQKINACVLGQAAASVVAQNIIGSSFEEMHQLRFDMEAMLKKKGEAPKGKWAQLQCLQPVADFAPRQASTLLVFDAVVACLEQIESTKVVAAKK